jgi:outer membrane protein TolC
VKEVEEALVRLDSASQRLPQARAAVAGYRTHFAAAQQLYQAGLGNLLDAETARRNSIAADLIVVDLQQEQVSAWIALYRAAGGSWEEPGKSSAEVKTSLPIDHPRNEEKHEKI